MQITKNHQDKILHLLTYIIIAGLIAISALAVLKNIFISFDIDEGYAVAQSYRLLKGDKMMLDLWEPHQFSSWAAALLMWPFLLITGNDTTGIVIYLRVIGSLIHLAIGIWFFLSAQKKFGIFPAAIIAFLHVNFLPKWVSMPEFELLHYWAVCIIFLSLLSLNENPKQMFWLILAGVSYFTTLLAYPTMLLLYPAYLISILFLTEKGTKKKFEAGLLFTLPIALIGFTFLGYLLSYQTPAAFMKNVGNILMDDSHSVSLLLRSLDYCKETLAFLGQFLICSALSFTIALILRIISRKSNPSVKLWKPEKLIVSTLLLAIAILSITQIVMSFLGDANQFFLYFRFLAIAILGFCLSGIIQKNSLPYLLFGLIPGVLSVLASAAITNMSFEIAMAKIYIAVPATAYLLCLYLKENADKGKIMKHLASATALIFILGLLVCKLLLVRVTGCISISVKMHMSPVQHGPVAGLLVEEKLATHFNHCIPLLAEHLTAEDNLLYFGCENIFYLASDAKIATPSVQGTSVFNEMYLHYYKEHPEKMPNVIIIDKTFETNPYYRYAPQNYIVAEWIEEEFADATVTETDYLKILRK